MKDSIPSTDLLAESARALAIMCRDTDRYRQGSGFAFAQATDEVLRLTQYVSDNAVEVILTELAKL